MSLSRTSRERDNSDWLRELRSDARVRDLALVDLRDYMLRAILVYLTRHRGDLAGLDYEEVRQLAEDCTQGALLQVLKGLDGFRGDSLFTTWAYRIAVNLTAAALRRHRWQTHSLDHLLETETLDADGIGGSGAADPETEAQRTQAWHEILAAIDRDLTGRQRAALLRYLRGEPTESIAMALGTNRNNVYKIVHDARRKLQRSLSRRGLTIEDLLAMFDETEAEDRSGRML